MPPDLRFLPRWSGPGLSQAIAEALCWGSAITLSRQTRPLSDELASACSAFSGEGGMTIALREGRFALAGTPCHNRAPRFATAGIQEPRALCKSVKRPKPLCRTGTYLPPVLG